MLIFLFLLFHSPSLCFYKVKLKCKPVFFVNLKSLKNVEKASTNPWKVLEFHTALSVWKSKCIRPGQTTITNRRRTHSTVRKSHRTSTAARHLWGPGSGSKYPISVLLSWKTSHIPKINMANIPKVQKALYPLISKIDPSIPYPFKYLQKYPVYL